MYVVSFRIKVGEMPGHQVFYLNGSAHSNKVYRQGETIQVEETRGRTYATATVIDTRETGRPEHTFKWEIYEKA